MAVTHISRVNIASKAQERDQYNLRTQTAVTRLESITAFKSDFFLRQATIKSVHGYGICSLFTLKLPD